MSDHNKNTVRRFFEEVWNKNHLELAEELLAHNYIDHNAPPGSSGGVEGYKQSVAMFRSAFPDIHFTLEDIRSEDSIVALRLMGHGTHKGIFMGFGPTDAKVSFGGMTFIRLENGKIVERWGFSDMGSLMMQLRKASEEAKAANPPREVIYVAPDESYSTTRVLGIINLCKATKQETDGLFSFFVSTVPAGEGIPNHTHLKEDEAYYILDGTFEIYDVTHKRTITVGPDSYVYVPRNVEHGFKNVGSDTGRMILIITPGGLEGFFEGIGQVITDVNNPPPPPTGPPDFIKAGRVAAQHNITFAIPE